MSFDIIIKNGRIVDGTGNPWYKADVGISSDRVESIGDLSGAGYGRTIDAGGLVVAPGFMDIHSHSDYVTLLDPRVESKIRQGVTTEVGGNCGSSYFPFSDKSFEKTKENLEKTYGLELDWRDVNGFFSRLEAGGSSFNYATFLGQGSLRDAVMGPYDRPPTDEELESMKRLVREHMEAGVLGLSSGLEYTPGSFAETDELIELCREMAPFGG
ncbi:amidohydrolase family protein, partial [Candidatus Bathyarchaeota archaeon]|nr:amidohydrolase family protein [Candidatus Bathyarchaeota archaeon]